MRYNPYMEILCSKLKKKLPKLKSIPIPSNIGNYIYENISEKAWDMWLEYQTKYINENKLNLRNNTDRKKLNKEMLLFLNITIDDIE